MQLEILGIRVEDGAVVEMHHLNRVPLYVDVERILLPGIDVSPNANSNLITPCYLVVWNACIEKAKAMGDFGDE